MPRPQPGEIHDIIDRPHRTRWSLNLPPVQNRLRARRPQPPRVLRATRTSRDHRRSSRWRRVSAYVWASSSAGRSSPSSSFHCRQAEEIESSHRGSRQQSNSVISASDPDRVDSISTEHRSAWWQRNAPAADQPPAWSDGQVDEEVRRRDSRMGSISRSVKKAYNRTKRWMARYNYVTGRRRSQRAMRLGRAPHF